MTPGATRSIAAVPLALIAPLPSIGLPNASTTRPSSSGPTGTSRMRPVVLTISPSEMCSYSPRITAPTESRSRFSARPNVLPGNSSISPCIALLRPWMRLMPSDSEITVPCVRTSAPVSRFLILPLISSLISDGFNCMFFPRAFAAFRVAGGVASVSKLDPQRVRHRLQFILHRSVDHRVADDDLRPADQRRIDADRCLDLFAEAALQSLAQRRELRVVDRKRTDDLRPGHAVGLVLQRIEQRADFRQQADAIGFDQHADEVPP